MDMIATILFGVLVTYVVIGLLAELAFVVVGVARVQPAPVTIGARILLLPGATTLRPLVLARWLSSRRAPIRRSQNEALATIRAPGAVAGAGPGDWLRDWRAHQSLCPSEWPDWRRPHHRWLRHGADQEWNHRGRPEGAAGRNASIDHMSGNGGFPAKLVVALLGPLHSRSQSRPQPGGVQSSKGR